MAETKNIAKTQEELNEDIARLLRKSEKSSGAGLDPAQLESMVDPMVKKMVLNLSIGLPNLSNEVLQFFNNFRPVQLMLPTKQVINVPNSGLIPILFEIIDDLTVGNNVFLYGEAGTGKTTLAVAIAEAMGVGVEVINCSQYTGPIDIIGGQTIEGYVEGRLIKAWRDGKLLILDELPKLDPNTAGLLNDGLAEASKTKAVIRNGMGQEIHKHENFYCIATSNTTGKGTSPRYNGNNKLDLSLIDRFSGSYYQVGFNEGLEKALIYSKPLDICWKIREQLSIHNIEEIMTLRTMISINKIYAIDMERETGKRAKVEGGKTFIDSLESYFNVMSPDQAQRLREAIHVTSLRTSYKSSDELAKFRLEWQRKNAGKEEEETINA